MIALDPKLFWKSFKEAHQSDEIGVMEKMDSSLMEWLQKNIQSRELLELLIEYPFAESVQLCANYFHGPESIKETTEMYQSIERSFIIVGSAACGDWIAIPRDNWDSIGYISHEEFGYDESELLKYCAVAQSIGEFYYCTWHKKNYPCDYCGAVTYTSNS